MADPMEGWQKLGPGDLVAHGLAKPGPLAGWVKRGADPAQNAQAIREGINPSPQPQSPPTEAPRDAQGVLQGVPPAIQQRFEHPFGLPRMPVAPASLAAPGAGILGNMLGQGAAAGGEALVQGRGPLQAGKEALGSALGSGVLGAAGKGVSKATSALRLPAYAEKISSDLASYLKKEVPAWEKISNVKDMLFSQRGVNKLHRAYDESLAEVVKKGTGKSVQIPAQAAEALGVEGAVGQNLSPAVRDALARAGKDVGTPGMVKVDAGELAQAMNGKGKGSTLGAYRAAAKALDEANIGDPAARKAYRTAMGLRDYLSKTGAITPQGTLDVIKAQAGLVKKGQVDELLKRDLGEEVTKILTPGGKALKKGSLAGPMGATGGILGGLSGAVGGHALGPLGPLAGVPLGAGFGAHQGAYIGGKIPTYKGIPEGPAQNAITQFLQRLGGMGGAKAAE
jgi:hypothetical protein